MSVPDLHFIWCFNRPGSYGRMIRLLGKIALSWIGPDNAGILGISNTEQFLRIICHFSANFSSHTFLLEFLQFVVGIVVYSLGFIYNNCLGRVVLCCFVFLLCCVALPSFWASHGWLSHVHVDTMVEWDVDVVLSHVTDYMCNSMHRKTLQHHNVRVYIMLSRTTFKLLLRQLTV